MSLIQSLMHRSVRQLTRAAAVLALVALALMAYSIVWPRPLAVIAAMSVGHVIGGLALLFYVLAIVLHSRRAPPPPDSLRPREPSEPATAAPQTTPE